MAAPAFQCEAWSTFSPCHASQDIRYIFLENCRNIPASHPLDGASNAPQGPGCCHPTAQHEHSMDEGCYSSLAQRLPAFPPCSPCAEMEAADVRGSPESKTRLPVFRQLCREAVEGLEELPDARAVLEMAKDHWRMAQAAACPTCNKA